MWLKSAMGQVLIVAITTCETTSCIPHSEIHKLTFVVMNRNLQTAYGNRGNTISQHLKRLKPRSEYDFSVKVQVPSPGGVEFCSVYVYAGKNATIGKIASAELFNFGEWETLTGTYKAKRPEEILSIVAACDSEDSSVTGNVWIDDIIFTGPGNCKPNSD